MEKVGQETEHSINQNNTKSTGLFFHKDMLLHKSSGEHPERPERVTSIMNKFDQAGLIDRCKVYDHFDEAQLEPVKEVHGEDYVDYVESLWDENSKKEVRFYSDTYYNKHTVRVAKLCVNAVMTAVDEIYSNNIKNAFAVTRPPGHHAAAKSHRIQGFCIYNHVAVAAKYAVKKYNLKRVLIFDWDVHHGDSTSKLFYKDPNILYISLHRYDNGGFYPQGEFASMKMTGDDEGKGYNLNFPWNLPHKYASIGDSEYIYALERVFIPIIKQFNPELVFISSGFDCGRGDPLGGLDVTLDGFAYMTKRLLEFAPERTILALEGGYNLETISESAEACLRIMLGESMPLSCSENLKTFEEMQKNCHPNEIAIKTTEEVLTVYSNFWPIVNEDKEALEYEQNIKKNIKENEGAQIIVGGHPEWFLFKQNKILKQAKKIEVDIYEDIVNEKSLKIEENKLLRELIATYYGTFELKDNTYIILENLTYKHPRASVIDIKLGTITYARDSSPEKIQKCIQKESLTTSGALGYRITGMKIRDKDGNLSEDATRSEIYYKVTPDNIEDHFLKFLLSNGAEKLNSEALKYYLNFVQNLLDFFSKTSTRCWIGSSILMVLDNKKQYYKASWIDLGHNYELEPGKKDENIIKGLENICKLLKHLYEKSLQ